MKKIYKFFVAAIVALMPLATSAETYDLYPSATGSSNKIPLDFYNTDNSYCRSQFTYIASELYPMNGKVITGIKFYATTSIQTGSNYNNLKVRVRVGNTSTSTFNNNTWNNSATGTVLVGSASISGNELRIYFKNGYYYTGGDLVFDIENVNKGTGMYLANTETNPLQFYGETYANDAYSAYGSNSTYPASGSPTTVGFTPRTTFTYYTPSVNNNCIWTDGYASNTEWFQLGDNNCWYSGDSTSSTTVDNNSIYVINGRTNGNNYNNTKSSKSFFYTLVDLEPNTEYVVSYDWKCDGESTYDFMRVALVNANTSLDNAGMVPGTATGWSSSSLPSGVIALDGGSKLNLQPTWQHKALVFRTSSAQRYRFVLYWCNDGSQGSGAAAIDRIRVNKLHNNSFHSDFERNNDWTLWAAETSTGYPFWGTGTDAGSSNNVGTKSMYVGIDAGHNYEYQTNNDASHITHQLPIRLKAGRYLVNYDWKCGGETNYDILRAGFVPFYQTFSGTNSQLPSNAIRAHDNTNLSGQTSWQHQSIVVNIPTDTVYFFYLRWDNDNSGGDGTPAAVDNLSITPIIENSDLDITFNSSYWNTDQGRGWTLANGAQTNYWNRGANAIYITNAETPSPTANNDYTISSTSTSMAYAAIQLAAGQYDISYQWKCSGESNYDYLRVALLPDNFTIAPGNYNFSYNNLPTVAIALDGGQKLNLQSDYQTFSGTFDVATAGVYKLVFFWHNDNSGGSTPPASISQLQIGAHVAEYTITVTSNNDEWGTVSGGGTYANGASATLTATPASGYRFVQWQDGNTDNPRTITVTADATYTATFAENAAISTVDQQQAAMSLYPNPATDHVTVDLSGVEGECLLSIIDLNGRTILTQKVIAGDNSTVDLSLSGIATGTYFVRLTSGSTNSINKLIVK